MSETTDRHANARDRKREKRRTSDAMRGRRSVFEIEKSIAKRGRKAKEKPRRDDGASLQGYRETG